MLISGGPIDRSFPFDFRHLVGLTYSWDTLSLLRGDNGPCTARDFGWRPSHGSQTHRHQQAMTYALCSTGLWSWYRYSAPPGERHLAAFESLETNGTHSCTRALRSGKLKTTPPLAPSHRLGSGDTSPFPLKIWERFDGALLKMESRIECTNRVSRHCMTRLLIMQHPMATRYLDMISHRQTTVGLTLTTCPRMHLKARIARATPCVASLDSLQSSCLRHGDLELVYCDPPR